MLKNALLLMPVLAAAMLIGCSGPEPASDEDFLESVRAAAETAPESDAASGMALEPGAKPGRIEVETDHVYIHDIPYDGLGEERIKIYNRGPGPLRIASVTTSCSCTVGHVENPVIPPGGETDLRITIYPEKIPGFEATRVLTITSNDPNTHQVPVIVTSYLVPELDVRPGNFNLGRVEAGKGLERAFHVRQLIDEPVSIQEVRTDSDYIEVDWNEIPEEQWQKPGHREYEIVLSLHPDSPIGALDSTLVIKTDLKRNERLVYDIAGRVHTKPYTFTPRVVRYLGIEPGTTMENIARLTADVPISNVSVQSDSSDLELIHQQGGSPNEVLFSLAVPADPAEPRIGQLWNLEFDLGGETYTEQLAATVGTSAPVPESD